MVQKKKLDPNGKQRENLPLPSLGRSMTVRILWLGFIHRTDLLHFSEGHMVREGIRIICDRSSST